MLTGKETKAMKFSVIVPAHNAAAYIHKALESVKQQTFTDYELYCSV